MEIRVRESLFWALILTHPQNIDEVFNTENYGRDVVRERAVSITTITK